MTSEKLTPKEQAFVNEYVGRAAGNGVAACKAAGYKGNPKVLAVQASRLLAKANVKLALDEHRAQTLSDGIMTATEVAVRLSGIAMGVVKEKRIISSGKDGFVEADLPPQCGTQIEAMKVLAKVRGYEAPTKSEVTGALLVGHLTPDQDSALQQWLMWREDPVIAARIAELEAE